MAALLVTLGIGALTFAIVKANDWGWGSAGVAGSFAVAIAGLGAFVRHCLRSKNPFVDPALFKVRPFTGASLVMAPYSAGFGAMLLSVALWEQTAWGCVSAQDGARDSPGPLCVPLTSLLFAGKLIKRFGAAAVITAGVLLFSAGLMLWAMTLGAEQPCCRWSAESP